MSENIYQELLKNHKGNLFENASIPELFEISIQGKEGSLSETGALRVETGKYTGRSPNDKFIVESSDVQSDIWWDNNKKISEAAFSRLYAKAMKYIENKDLFVFNGFAGADRSHTLPIRIINEFAWQNIFVQQLFIRSSDTGWESPAIPGFTVLCIPGLTAVPAEDETRSEAFIILNFAKRLVLIGGTHYAGEMKKSIFSVINYLMPKQDILSMHCSANQGTSNDLALFFGLSGTGKTSLSADPDRFLIGDDEHCWTDKGIFNVEGGCYAKCISLSRENEPQIWDSIKFGTILENVVMDPQSRKVDYASEAITENTRAAYPVHFIPQAIYPGIGKHPATIIFLTADAFGVLPPIAKLSAEQAQYYFLSGYTSKLAGTERGITEPEATFSACFGAPFLPLHPMAYAKLLKEKIAKHDSQVFLINTGWQGGGYGVGKRISIAYTRKMVSAALAGSPDFENCNIDPIFNLAVPKRLQGIPDNLLQPSMSWADPVAYKETAMKLAVMFDKNFKKFSGIPKEVIESGPSPLVRA